MVSYDRIFTQAYWFACSSSKLRMALLFQQTGTYFRADHVISALCKPLCRDVLLVATYMLQILLLSS